MTLLSDLLQSADEGKTRAWSALFDEDAIWSELDTISLEERFMRAAIARAVQTNDPKNETYKNFKKFDPAVVDRLKLLIWSRLNKDALEEAFSDPERDFGAILDRLWGNALQDKHIGAALQPVDFGFGAAWVESCIRGFARPRHDPMKVPFVSYNRDKPTEPGQIHYLELEVLEGGEGVLHHPRDRLANPPEVSGKKQNLDEEERKRVETERSDRIWRGSFHVEETFSASMGDAWQAAVRRAEVSEPCQGRWRIVDDRDKPCWQYEFDGNSASAAAFVGWHRLLTNRKYDPAVVITGAVNDVSGACKKELIQSVDGIKPKVRAMIAQAHSFDTMAVAPENKGDVQKAFKDEGFTEADPKYQLTPADDGSVKEAMLFENGISSFLVRVWGEDWNE